MLLTASENRRFSEEASLTFNQRESSSFPWPCVASKVGHEKLSTRLYSAQLAWDEGYELSMEQAVALALDE
jgi:hypothetical protein